MNTILTHTPLRYLKCEPAHSIRMTDLEQASITEKKIPLDTLKIQL